jgi:arylformamidase
MLYDLSPPISPALAVWPGDSPASREVLQDLARGDSVTLSTLRATVHLGAHADAPSHYGVNAPAMDERPLELYLGECQVMRVPAERGSLITPGLLPAAVSAPRVLLATGTAPDLAVFNRDFAALAPELIDHLHQQGVRLVGVDTPSVDPSDSKTLPAHHRCLEHNMAILEGLRLAEVPEGRYELIALPLRLVGFDASPVRAVLRSWR